MQAEREFEAGAAITIALAIIPMNWLAYVALSLILAALIGRVLWLSVRNVWERWIAIVCGVALLVVLTVPEFIARFAADMSGVPHVATDIGRVCPGPNSPARDAQGYFLVCETRV